MYFHCQTRYHQQQMRLCIIVGSDRIVVGIPLCGAAVGVAGNAYLKFKSLKRRSVRADFLILASAAGLDFMRSIELYTPEKKGIKIRMLMMIALIACFLPWVYSE